MIKEMKLQKYPALRLMIMTCISILLGDYFKTHLEALLIISTILSICLFISLAFSFFSKNFLFKCTSIIFSIVAFCSIHATYSAFEFNSIATTSILHHSNKKLELTGTVISNPTKKSFLTFIVNVKNIRLADHPEKEIPATGKVIIHASNVESPELGDAVQVKGILTLPRKAQSKDDFNYRAYLQTKDVYTAMYIRGSASVKIIDDLKTENLLLRHLVYPLTKHLATSIDKLISEGEERSLIKGLVLGDRTSISSEIIAAFRNTGLVHVLSISGLHVGLITLLINMLATRFRTTVLGKWASFFVSSLLLILYASITGGSPPVARAVVMAISFMLAQALGRLTYPVNTLFFAGAVLLIYNPNNLFSPSFHLSMAAVLGILLIYPKLNSFFYSKNRVLIKIKNNLLWKGLSLTLSASLSTMPLISFYFGGIPLLGLLANIIVVNLISLSIYSMIPALILENIWHTLGTFYAYNAQVLTNISIKTALFFSEIPYAKVNTTFELGAILIVFAVISMIFSGTAYRIKAILLFLISTNIVVWNKVLSTHESPFHRIIFRRSSFETIGIYKNPTETILINPPRKPTKWLVKDLEKKDAYPVSAIMSTYPVSKLARERLHTTYKGDISNYSSPFIRINIIPNATRLETKQKNIWLANFTEKSIDLNFKKNDVLLLNIQTFSRHEYQGILAILKQTNLKFIVINFTHRISQKTKHLFYWFSKKHPVIKTVEKHGEILIIS